MVTAFCNRYCVMLNATTFPFWIWTSLLFLSPGFGFRCMGTLTYLSFTRENNFSNFLFSSPGRSPGRAIVLPPALAWALAKSLTLKFFLCDGQGAVRRAILSLWQLLFLWKTFKPCGANSFHKSIDNESIFWMGVKHNTDTPDLSMILKDKDTELQTAMPNWDTIATVFIVSP